MIALPRRVAPWLRMLCAFALLLSLTSACSDTVDDPNKCRATVCGENAFCVPDTGLCLCADGFEDDGDACVPARCKADADCADARICNGSETCDLTTGACVGGAPVTCDVSASCQEPDGQCVCDQGHTDYGDGCEPTVCTEASDCDDGLACNGIESCDLGTFTCVLGAAVDCGPASACAEDTGANGYRCDDLMAHCMLMSTTDWGSVGMLAVMDLETGVIKDNLTSYHQDAGIHVVDGEVYVLNRHLGDSVLKLDADDQYKKLWDFSVAYGTVGVPNPHDIVRNDDELYIALYNEGIVLRANARPNPLDTTSFLGLSIKAKRITPPAWDGAFSELTALRIDQGVLFGLTQGLGDSFSCDTPDNHSRIYAWTLPDLEDAPVFANGKNYLELAHCNAGNWVDMPDGRLLIHSLGTYRFMSGDVDDGGLQIVDLHNRVAGPVVANEAAAAGRDIVSVVRVESQYYAILAGDDFFMLDVVEVHPSAGLNDPWTFDSTPFYQGYAWSLFGFRDHLYIAERAYDREVTLKFDRATKMQIGSDIQTTYSPESMTYFQRAGSCW